MLRYMSPHSTDTLRSAISELRRTEGADGDMSDAGELAPHMQLHDAIHVLFGCGTSLLGEVQAHLWMLLGTSARMRDMHRTASSRDHRAALADIGHAELLKTWLRALPELVSIALRARKMSRRWPAEQLAACLDRPLQELRAEYNIEIR